MTILIDQVAAPVPTDNNGKEVVFKNCAPFTDLISERNNAQIDNPKYIDVVILMYNLIECSTNYSKPLVSLWQYYGDKQI